MHPEILCQELLSVDELVEAIRNTTQTDKLVASIFTLYLDQVFFDVEETLEHLNTSGE
jgi:hypothetical protein